MCSLCGSPLTGITWILLTKAHSSAFTQTSLDMWKPSMWSFKVKIILWQTWTSKCAQVSDVKFPNFLCLAACGPGYMDLPSLLLCKGNLSYTSQESSCCLWTSSCSLPPWVSLWTMPLPPRWLNWWTYSVTMNLGESSVPCLHCPSSTTSSSLIVISQYITHVHCSRTMFGSIYCYELFSLNWRSWSLHSQLLDLHHNDMILLSTHLSSQILKLFFMTSTTNCLTNLHVFTFHFFFTSLGVTDIAPWFIQYSSEVQGALSKASHT